jgi:hypothetical protein
MHENDVRDAIGSIGIRDAVEAFGIRRHEQSGDVGAVTSTGKDSPCRQIGTMPSRAAVEIHGSNPSMPPRLLRIAIKAVNKDDIDLCRLPRRREDNLKLVRSVKHGRWSKSGILRSRIPIRFRRQAEQSALPAKASTRIAVGTATERLRKCLHLPSNHRRISHKLWRSSGSVDSVIVFDMRSSRTNPIIGGVWPLTEWHDAFEKMHKGEVVKSVLRPV